ncbi:MAG: ParA family protein [Gammaproteobacteria bacterium]
MKILATYNLKGGVGKTAAAVNLAYYAHVAGARTLIWDLDPQGAASFYFKAKARIKGGSERLLGKKREMSSIVRATDYANISLVPADIRLRNFDSELSPRKDGDRRIGKLLSYVKHDYDICFLDCPPSMSTVAENVFRSADRILVPIIPTPLSIRAYGHVREFFSGNDLNTSKLLPFFSMVDRRKKLHRQLIIDFAKQHPELLPTYIPYISQIEQMGIHQAPVGAFAPNGIGARAFGALFKAIADRTGLPF